MISFLVIGSFFFFSSSFFFFFFFFLISQKHSAAENVMQQIKKRKALHLFVQWMLSGKFVLSRGILFFRFPVVCQLRTENQVKGPITLEPPYNFSEPYQSSIVLAG